MIDDRELFDRAVQRFAPADGSFERLITRRDRKQRNKRVTAGVVALLLAAVVIGAALRAIQTGPPVPVTPTPSPSASNGDISFVGSNLIDFSDDLDDSRDPVRGRSGRREATEAARYRVPVRPRRHDIVRTRGHRERGLVAGWDPHRLHALRRTRKQRGARRDLRDGDRNRAGSSAHIVHGSCASTRMISIGPPMDRGSGTWSRSRKAARPAPMRSTPRVTCSIR